MARILLLEDDTILREELTFFLVELGHCVLEAGTLAEFDPLIPATDVAIIDILLPDGDGFEAVVRMRAARPSSGVIILTACGALADKVHGFSVGADHYLLKPICLEELSAILRALLRRVSSGWQLYLKERCLSSPEGQSCALSPLEMVLFDLLSRQPDQRLSRQILVTALGHHWMDYDVRRLEKLVSRLRQRWKVETGQLLPLKTVHRYGYSFGAEIHRV
jgi:two-component system, OmpR family, response regulator